MTQPVDATVARTRRFRRALTLALAGSFAVSGAIGGFNTAQAFSSFGQIKQLVLPPMFVLFALVLVWRGKGEPPIHVRLPRLASSLLWIVIGSTVLSAVVARADTSVTTTAEGLVLVLGMVLSITLGYSVTSWPAVEQDRLLWVLIVAALVSLLVGGGPFVSLAVPGMFGAALLAVRSPRQRGRMLLAVIVLAVLYARDVAARAAVGPVSVAVNLELAICALVFVLAVLPKGARKLLLTVLGVAAAVALVANIGQFSYVVGDSLFDDVTLAQRGYETAQVFGVVGQSPFALLFGAGPGGFVNLVLSPDASTLLYSGRDLLAVDDVHLLSSDLLLKFGVVGLIWLGALLWQVKGIAAAILRERRPDTFDVVLLMFVLAGIVVGIPAANNFLANPLPALFLGVLARRWSGDGDTGDLGRGRRGAAAAQLRRGVAR